MIEKIEAVLFDLDGVLLDACDWHYESLNRALREVLGIEISREDHLTTFNGLPTKVKLQVLNVTGESFDRVQFLKQQYTIAEIKKSAKEMKEKIELHSFLKNNDVKIACVTNSIRSNTELMLKMTGQLEFMDLIVSNEDVSNNKPSPDCYNLAIEKLRVSAQNSVCVEDSDKGFEAAIKSNASRVIRVKNTGEVNLQNFKRILF